MRAFCEMCGQPPTYEMIHTTVMGDEVSQLVCTEHAIHGHSFVLANNDASFAGPEAVIETISYRLLKAEQFRSMASDPLRRSWTAPCLPREFITIVATGRDGDVLDVGVRYGEAPIEWYEEGVENLDAVRARHRGEGLREMGLVPHRPNHPQHEFHQVWP